MGQPMMAYGGPWAGFNTMYIKFPEADLSVVVLSNNANISAGGKAYDLAAIFLDDNQEETSGVRSVADTNRPKTITLSQEQLKAFEGDYFNYNNGYIRNIHAEGDKLIYDRVDATAYRLSPISENSFLVDNSSFQIVITFRPTTSGKMTMYVKVEDSPESEYVFAEIPNYTEVQLGAFEGNYYCADLDVTYTLKAVDGQLESFIGKHEFFTWSPVMDNLFNDAHFGYLLFEKDRRGRTKSFTMNNALGTLKFVKQ